jgi:tetratricopeptide (TPR) repeat protein
MKTTCLSIPGGNISRLRSLPRLLASIGLVALIAGPAAADVVVRTDGMEVKGRVVDLGGSSIEVQTRGGGSRKIRLGEIRSATFDAGEAAGASGQDVVFRKNGTEVAGDVTRDEKFVHVTGPDGAKVSIPLADVARIVMRDEERGGGVGLYSEKTEADIKAAIAKVQAGGEGIAEAEETLKSLGIFAIFPVRDAAKKAKAGSPAAEALARVERLYRIKEITDEALEELPDYYRILSSGNADEKRDILTVMFTRHVTESVPIAKFLILEPREDYRVRAFAVALLGQHGLNRDLVSVYNDPAGGQVQLAAALALAKNRLLLGAESLIQGLELERPELRELSFKALRDAAGKDFGYGVHDTPAARKEAIARWRKWWAENRSSIQKQGTDILAGRDRPEDTAERKKATKLWGDGCLAMERSRYVEAEASLRAAGKADPTFHKARVSLGVLLCLHRGKGPEGQKLLRDVLDRPPGDMDQGELPWIHHYLGHAFEMAGELDKAQFEYGEALRIDPRFFRANLALGDLKFRWAISGSVPAGVSRKKLLADAEVQYRAAIGLIEESSNSIDVLALEDLPPESQPAFQRQEHNQGVVALKAGLRLLKADAYFGIGKIRSLLDDRPRAIENVGSGIETLGDDRDGGARERLVEMHNYRAFLQEEEGRYEEAIEDYRAVTRTDLDPRNAAALEGIRRLGPPENAAPGKGERPRTGRPKAKRATKAPSPSAE